MTKEKPDGPFGSIKWKNSTRYMLIYFIFGILWKNAFISALCMFILGSSVCIWYFSPMKPNSDEKNCHNPIKRSIYRAFRYHLGSLAFGSLILAIV